jgi:hypothetical protein
VAVNGVHIASLDKDSQLALLRQPQRPLRVLFARPAAVAPAPIPAPLTVCSARVLRLKHAPRGDD